MKLSVPNSLPQCLRQATSLLDLTTGQKLFWQGAEASAMFVVIRGRIKLLRHTNEGKIVALQVVSAGESVAENALFCDVYSCTAVAEVASKAIAYPKQLLLSALDHYPQLTIEVMRMLARKNQHLEISLELRAIRAAHQRVWAYLRYQAVVKEQQNCHLIIDRPLKEIASELNLTPESLSRALAKLEKEGIITRLSDCITLHKSYIN